MRLTTYVLAAQASAAEGEDRRYLSSTDTKVLATLSAAAAEVRSETAVIAASELSARVGVSERTIQRSIARLAEVGLIIREARSNANGRQISNGYRLSHRVPRQREAS